MKELLIYGISACASLIIFGYTVHIFIGGMVSNQTEWIVITAITLAGLGVMAFLAWDVLRRRRN